MALLTTLYFAFATGDLEKEIFIEQNLLDV
jgi:hypothetical protein